MNLFHRTYGNKSTPTLIILHGVLGCSDNWHTAAKTLGAQFHVLVPDLRGHGRSPHAPGFSIPILTNDILDFMDAHDIPAAHILGHSLGGKIAMHLTLAAPERVRHLIVADIAPRAYLFRTSPELEAMQALAPAMPATREDADSALARSIHTPAVRQFLLKNLTRGNNGRLHWRCDLAELAKNFPRILEAVESSGTTFSRPALFLRGGRSTYVTDADFAEIHRLFPGAKSVTIPDAGHWIHADAPETFLAHVKEFIT
jgi:esterase